MMNKCEHTQTYEKDFHEQMLVLTDCGKIMMKNMPIT
jgi:hypothetical protein